MRLRIHTHHMRIRTHQCAHTYAHHAHIMRSHAYTHLRTHAHVRTRDQTTKPMTIISIILLVIAIVCFESARRYRMLYRAYKSMHREAMDLVDESRKEIDDILRQDEEQRSNISGNDQA